MEITLSLAAYSPPIHFRRLSSICEVARQGPAWLRARTEELLAVNVSSATGHHVQRGYHAFDEPSSCLPTKGARAFGGSSWVYPRHLYSLTENAGHVTASLDTVLFMRAVNISNSLGGANFRLIHALIQCSSSSDCHCGIRRQPGKSLNNRSAVNS